MKRFDAEQRSHWASADPAHERWRACGPIRQLEEALFTPVSALLLGEALLDVGCAEADTVRTLRSLGYRGRYTGIDFSVPKISYAHASFPGAGLAAADAARLPFRDRTFPTVLCRDLLHHVGCRAEVVSELLRVAQERVVLIEPNPLAPLIVGLGLLRRFERGLFRSSPGQMRALLRRPGWTTWDFASEPHSLARLTFHYRFGLPSLATSRTATAALRLLDRAAVLLPRALWSYQVFILDRVVR